MIFRLSQNLADKIKVAGLTTMPPADDPLTDFTLRLFNVSRTQYVLASNTNSLYSTVLYARGVNAPHALIVSVLRSLSDVMEEDGLQLAYQGRVAPASGGVRFGKTLSRSVTGSMNDLVEQARWWLGDPDVSPDEVARKLNDTLLSALRGPDGKPYGKPREALRASIVPRH